MPNTKTKAEKIEDALGGIESAISDADKSYNQLSYLLSDENEDDKVTKYESLLERLADHRNWIDGRYAPIIKELYDDVPSLCASVLRENQ